MFYKDRANLMQIQNNLFLLTKLPKHDPKHELPKYIYLTSQVPVRQSHGNMKSKTLTNQKH